MSSGSSYDFNRREDFDYTHSYDYLGGMGLGREEVEAARVKNSKRGKYDMEPVAPPLSVHEKEEIIKTARLLNASRDRISLLKKIEETKDARVSFVWNESHPNRKYFDWVMHCLEREVLNWESIRPGLSVASAKSDTLDPRADSSENKKHANLTVSVGNCVAIKNLKSRPELNGKVGKVVREENSRWIVQFADIGQTVSLNKVNCVVSENSHDISSTNNKHLPKGLRVEVTKLTSESGQAINGLTGYVVEYSQETQRYIVRLEDGQAKSFKMENLLVCLPEGWDQRTDESSGKVYYVERSSGNVSWNHPIFGGRDSSVSGKKDFVNPSEEVEEEGLAAEVKDTETSFSRAEFLASEAKRLKLDQKERAKGATAEKIIEKLTCLRKIYGLVGEDRSSGALYSGNPRILLGNIDISLNTEERNKFLFVALSVMLEDYKQLRFSKTQLTALTLKLDEIIDAKGVVDAPTLEWIKSGLKIAIPINYVIY